ncbi:MAG: hypothetical protein ABI758_05035 [Candidatus Woesebacteria bacterium]
MKNTFLAVVSAFAVFTVSTGIVLATDTSPRPVQIRTQEIKDARKDIRTGNQNERKELRASISASRQTFRSERAKMHAKRLETHFNWYTERLGNIADRIQTRIDKEKTEGKNVTSAQTALDQAKTQLTVAISDGQKAVDLFAAITVSTWDVQKPEVKTAIDAAQKARSEFAHVHQLLADALKALATN